MSDQPIVQTEPLTDRLISRTPWWAISVGLHAALALVLTFVVVLGKSDEGEEAILVRPPQKTRPMPEYEPPKDQTPTNQILDIQKTSEQTMWEKKDDTKTESDDYEKTDFVKGDDTSFVHKSEFKSKSTNTSIGLQGGGGGRYGTRIGGQNDHTKIGGGGPDTQNAVREALKWLARHQNADGSWGVQGYTDRCGALAKFPGRCIPNPGAADYDAGVTGLALLAFFGAGYSHVSKDVWDGIAVGDVIRRGCQWLMSKQDNEGCIGPRAAAQYMYNHLICALALSEAYGVTGSFLYKDAAQRAVNFTVAAQNPDRGWRYSFRSGDNDTSVSGWGAMVLKSAEMSGLDFPRSAYDGVRAWLDETTEADYYRVGYTHRGTGQVYDEHNRSFTHHEALTAIGMMARIFIDRNRGDARLHGGAQLLLRDLPKWEANDIDFYHWYNGSLAMFQYDGPAGPGWTKWNAAMKTALVKNQNGGGSCKSGSWEPVDRWSCEGGRVYATAINCLTLEVYYRYANVFGAR